jgi:hypothetical protein
MAKSRTITTGSRVRYTVPNGSTGAGRVVGSYETRTGAWYTVRTRDGREVNVRRGQIT